MNKLSIFTITGLILAIILSSPLYATQDLGDINSIVTDFQNSAFDQGKEEEVPLYDPNHPTYNEDDLEGQAALEAQDNDNAKLVNDYFVQNDFSLSKDDEMFDKAKEITIDPKSEVDFVTEQYSDCEGQEAQSVELTETKTCDEFLTGQTNICQSSRVVEVENNYNYSCSKNIAYTTKNCTQNLNVVVQGEELGEEHFGNAVLCNAYYASYLDGYISISCSSNVGPFLPAVGQKIHLNIGSHHQIYEINSVVANGVLTEIGLGSAWWHYYFTVSEPLPEYYGNYNYSTVTVKTQTSFPDTPITTTSWEETCS